MEKKREELREDLTPRLAKRRNRKTSSPEPPPGRVLQEQIVKNFDQRVQEAASLYQQKREAVGELDSNSGELDARKQELISLREETKRLRNEIEELEIHLDTSGGIRVIQPAIWVNQTTPTSR